MAEYIDKQELLRDLERKIKGCNEYRMAVVDSDFIDLVNDATVLEDVVEVVRCKDCKHYNVLALACMYPRFNGYTGIDGYCSRGERNEV